MHGHPKFFVVKWLGLSVTVRVRARDREWTFVLPSLCGPTKNHGKKD